MNPETKPGNIRAFVAVPVAEAVREAIARETERWREALPARPIRWVRPEQLHLTLRFFGTISSTQIDEVAQAVERAAVGVPPFDLTAEGWGVFPAERNPRVLWVDVGGEIEILRRLQQQIESSTAHWGEPPEARDFHAHLTVARVKDATALERKRISSHFGELRAEPLGSWNVEHVELMQSALSPDGPRYTCLRSIALAGE